jgi:hypothetical protein
MTILELRQTQKNRDAVLTERLRAIHQRHKLMLALLDAAVTLRDYAEEVRQQDEDRRTRLARLGAANDRGDA